MMALFCFCLLAESFQQSINPSINNIVVYLNSFTQLDVCCSQLNTINIHPCQSMNMKMNV